MQLVLSVALRCCLLTTCELWLLSPTCGQVVKPEPQDSRLTDWLPDVGTQVPRHELVDRDGNPFPTSDFKDHYTVLVFGCLT